MTAWVDVIAGPPTASSDLEHALIEAGVVFGVDAEACSELAGALADPHFVVRQKLVARGLPAVAGSDGRFIPAFEPGIQPGHIGADGMMDFRDRELLKTVRSGDVVGELRASAAGAPGKQVDGVEIPVPPVRDATLHVGEGLTLQADGQIVAEYSGHVVYIPQKSLELLQQHVHRGPVDLRSGNLEMRGSLTLYGDVERRFRVRATRDVEIHGSVNCGSVYAGGALRVRGVVRGGDRAEVWARGDLSVRSAERARLTSHGQLTLDSAIYCVLTAESIQVGILRGGQTRAVRSIMVNEAGSVGGADTVITTGVSTERPSEEGMQAVHAAKQESELKQWLSRVTSAAFERFRTGTITRGLAVLKREQPEARSELVRRTEQILKAQIVVKGIVHPGVTIRIGPAVLPISEKMARVCFRLDANTGLVRAEPFVP